MKTSQSKIQNFNDNKKPPGKPQQFEKRKTETKKVGRKNRKTAREKRIDGKNGAWWVKKKPGNVDYWRELSLN